MAFVRWRGDSATLLATVYRDGRSQQVLLAALGTGYTVPSGVRESVTRRFAHIPVDWAAVNRAMAVGPRRDEPLSDDQMSCLQVENFLREWAADSSPYPAEANLLNAAANVLTERRIRAKG
jgi:hypothetical protein